MTLFTVEQANRTLPLVRRIVEDIVREHRRWQEKILELEKFEEVVVGRELKMIALEKESDRLRREIEHLKGEAGRA